MIHNQPITGNEVTNSEASPYTALVEFYRAFNQANFELMTQNWLIDKQASMSNPLGGVKRGWDDIKQVYQRIFFGPAEVYVEFYDYSIFESETMFSAVGRERGLFKSNGVKIELDIRTSRSFVFQQGRWKQLHHHGSIDKPELLEQYQQAVLQD